MPSIKPITLVQNPLLSGSSNVRTWNVGLNGKNYFGDWTFSYDYTKATNFGYASNIQVTNPNILNLYVERRFLKDHRGTIRISGFDLFNQNTGFSSTTSASAITESHVNRLSRYFLATFTLRYRNLRAKPLHRIHHNEVSEEEVVTAEEAEMAAAREVRVDRLNNI